MMDLLSNQTSAIVTQAAGLDETVVPTTISPPGHAAVGLSLFHDVLFVARIISAVIGVLVNGLFIFVWSMVPSFRVKETYLVVALSIVDFVVSFLQSFNVYTFESNIPENIIGWIYCHYWRNNTVYWTAQGVSSFVLSLIAMEKYLAVCHPYWFDAKYSIKGMFVAIACYIVGQLLIFDMILFIFVYYVDNSECRVRDLGDFQFPFFMILFLTRTLFPLCMMIGFYCGILIEVRKMRNAATFGENQEISRSLQNSTKTFGVVVLVYLVCWIPNTISYYGREIVIKLLNSEHSYDYYSSALHNFTGLLTLFNNVANPVIYMLRYRRFQNAVRKLLRCQTQVGSHSALTNSTANPAITLPEQ